MKTCLLVDDLPEALGLMSSLIHDSFPDLAQTHAGSFQEACEVIRRQDFDLALVDLELGDGRGQDLILMLARLQPACLRVVSTIFDDDDRLFSALQVGAQGYVLKDQTSAVVAYQLQGIRRGQPPLSPSIARRLIRHFRQTPEVSDDPVRLSEREQEVLGLLAQGLRLADIAQSLQISRHTVGDHVKSIYRKLNISSRAEAALAAHRLGLVS